MNPEFLNLAISKFYSRIVLKKLSRIALTHYRKVENLYKKVLKLSADIRYLEYILVIVLFIPEIIATLTSS